MGPVFQRRADAGEGTRDLPRPAIAYIWIGILTFTTYTLAGFMREQVCLYMCPWPRIQAALTDERAQRHLSLRPWRTAHVRQEGQGTPCAPQRARRRLRGLQPVRQRLPDGRRHSRRLQHGLHPVRPVHRRLRQRDAQARRNERLIAYDTDVNIKRRLEGKENVFAGAHADRPLRGPGRRDFRADGWEVRDARRCRTGGHP